MNMKEAKVQLKQTIQAYFARDAFGNLSIPQVAQRPLLLMGPPGIGKTAIAHQAAQECGIGIVAYTMTHHTRQSAIGLPSIQTGVFDGKEYKLTEYTMSEIIASVYQSMERTGLKSGILFLDEINCVSETLTPAILQFLQYKVFGRHRVPDGWIVVTAGNPPEYNRSIHDFDIATWDRLKRIDVDPDFAVWKEYAVAQGVHPAVLTYLEIRPDDFYRVETTVDGKSFVTARGWDDLSQMIKLYERNGIVVDGLLVGQYVQNAEIAKRFAVYYDLFNKYKSDYQVEDILDGAASEAIKARAVEAGFDERISLIGLLMDALGERLRAAVLAERAVELCHGKLAALKEGADEAALADVREACAEASRDVQKQLDGDRAAGTLSREAYEVRSRAIAFFDEIAGRVEPASFDDARALFGERVDELDGLISTASASLDNALAFVEDAYGEGQEMLLVITDLSVSRYGMAFINQHGCERYFKHNENLLFYERGKDIVDRIERMDLDED